MVDKGVRALSIRRRSPPGGRVKTYDKLTAYLRRDLMADTSLFLIQIHQTVQSDGLRFIRKEAQVGARDRTSHSATHLLSSVE